MRRAYALAALIVLLVCSLPAVSANKGDDDQGRGWALDVKAGTLGIGADVSRSIVPRVLNFRAGASFFNYSKDISEKGIDYNGKLKLGAVPIVLDVFPFKNWFRLGGGVVINMNEVTGTASSTGTLTIGDNKYSMSDVGQLEAKVKFNRAAPYFGFGFNNPIKKRGHHLGFFVDLGILCHGSPTAQMTSSKTYPQLQADIDKQLKKTNDDIKDFKIFPVIQLGFSYHF